MLDKDCAKAQLIPQANIIGLIAGGSGHTLTEELHRIGKKVVLVGGQENERGMDIAEKVFVCDMDYGNLIIDFFKKQGVKEVLIGTGHIKVFHLAEVLERASILTSINTTASLLAKNKTAYKRALLKQGLPTPEFLEIHQISEVDLAVSKIGLPCVVKSPVDKLLPQKANTREELYTATREVLAQDTKALIEEFVVGIDITIPVDADYEQVTPLLVSYYSKSREVGLKGFSAPIKQTLSPGQEKRAMEIAAEAVKATGIVGLCRIDMMVDMHKNEKILECNSVTVTGTNSPQAAFSEHFICAENKKHSINLAAIMVNNALRVFNQKHNNMGNMQ